jgi:hypothetical protein
LLLQQQQQMPRADLFLIRDYPPWALRARTQVGRPIGLSASDRDGP